MSQSPTDPPAGRYIPSRYALIPTHNRPVELAACIRSLAWQAHTFVVVDNACDPPVDTYRLLFGDPLCRVVIIRDEEQPPNLARLWNVGLDLVAKLATSAGLDEWDVAVLNDDAIVPPGWFAACTAAMRAGPAVVACSGPHGPLDQLVLKTAPDNDIRSRMCPHAFVTRGEVGLRADESMRWWYFDTQWDLDARAAGGVALIAGYPTQNTRANSSTVGALAEQAAIDRATFAAKHGAAPW